MSTTPSESFSAPATQHDWLEVVRQNVAHLRYGSVQITIHEGRVTQVESIEKTRFLASRDDAALTKK
jgi:hypothetical protein